tara:strand:- start:10018 stop:13302 length:3285 start_codon:yes stop_codon:yes gene_type:complete
MKTFVFLFCTTVFSLNPYNLASQNSKIKIDDDKVLTVDEVFDLIMEQTDYKFFYEEGVFKDFPKVQVKKGIIKTNKLLNLSLTNANLSVVITPSKSIVITKIPLENSQNPIQDYKVTGTVTDANGQPLPGANVLEKGTTNGTQTDFDGNFSINTTDQNAVLVVSYLGFKTNEVVVNDQNQITVILQEDAASLDEVVVIGYGTVKKSDLTGSVVSADIKSFRQSPEANVFQAIKGSIPGLNISQTTQAGEETTLSIRGRTSISGSQSPLIVVDNIIYRGSLNDINPSDIKSIDVLKDASATAVYGSQATNGVIMITTKVGEGDGKPIISFSSAYSVLSPTKELRPSNTEQFTQKAIDYDWRNSYLESSGYTILNPNYNVTGLLGLSAAGFANGTDTDWWGLLTNNSPDIQNHNLSVRGKSKNTSYFISTGITDQKNFLVNDNFKRNTIRINIDNKITDWLSVGVKSFIANSDFSGASPDIRTIHIIPSVTTPYDDNGELIVQPWFAGVLNPLLRQKVDDLEERLNIDGAFYADVKLPIEGLSYRLSAALKRSTYKHYFFNPWGENQQGTGYKYNAFDKSYTLDNILTYKKTFNDVHDINVTLLYGRENRSQEFTRTEASVFTNDVLGYNSLEAGNADNINIDTGAWEENSLYSMARLFYTYDNKYMLTGTIRRDGFSGFSEKNKFGVFPSVALGWVISNESFLEESNSINNLKLRASYGVNGNRTLGRYQTLASVTSEPSYLYGDGASPVNGQSVERLPNEDLKWETTTGLNIGLDFGLFNSKVFGSIDYYTTKTEDLLYDINIPTVNGFSGVTTNIGQIDNKGLEINLSATPVRTDSFSWDVGLNFSRNRNKVATILGRDDDGDGREDDLVSNSIFIGEPLGVWYDYEIDGMWQVEDEINGNILAGFTPGSYKLSDLDNSGDITPGGDRKILGFTDPSYRLGLKNNFSYKNFDLMIFINTVQGGKDYYYGNADIQEGGWTTGNNVLNYAYPGWDYWTPNNPNATYPQLNQTAAVRPTLHQQRNFVRLQNVSFSYNFPKKLLQQLRLSSLKLYVSGTNLATWTKWKGWDPEANIGIESRAFPVMKNYTFGFNVEF